LIALAEAFGFTVVGVNECGKYERRDELVAGEAMAGPGQHFQSFAEFYPYYLSEHSCLATRRLHFIGTRAAIVLVVAFAVTLNWWLLLAAPAAGYLAACVAPT
jgi:hypothetical protein